MGGTFDPQALMALLNGSQGNSQGLNPPPAQPSGQPDDYTNAVMGAGQPGQDQQPPQNNAQNAGPVKAGLRGVLARMLGNFSYGAGQAMLKAAGDETDAEKATRLAQAAHLNAQTQLIQQQSQMVPFQLGDGTVVHLPPKMATDLLKQRIANQGKADVAGINVQGKKDVAVTAGNFALQKEGLKQQFSSGQVSKLVPGINPDTQQPSYQMLNKQGQSIGWVENSVVPSLMAHTSSTVEYKEDSDGNIVTLPKNTSRGVVLPNSNSPAPTTPQLPPGVNPPKAVMKGKGANVMMVGTDPQGKQVAGTPGELKQAGLNNFVKLDSGESAKVNTARQLTSPGGLFDLIDKDLSQFKPGELEGLSPRWNEFLAGTVGTADPRYVALRTHLNGLLSTALMQAHVGARGGERIMEHFEDLANAGKMSLPTLKSALGAEKQYVEEKAMRPTPAGGFNWASAPLVNQTK